VDAAAGGERLEPKPLGLGCHDGVRRGEAVAQSFSSFHDKLSPTSAELADRCGDHLALLSSPVASTVGFALRHLSTIDRAGRIDARTLIEHVGPALAIRPKGHVKRAIALLRCVCTREPALGGEAVDLLLDALAHDGADVQAAALEAIEQLPGTLSEEQHERLSELAEQLDPGVRDRARRLAGSARPVPERDAATPASRPDPVAPVAPTDPLDPTRTIAAVADIEELLELTAVLLQRPDSAEELERFLDGVSRLCAEPVPETRSAAVLRQIDREVKRWPGQAAQARTVVAVVGHHWLRGTEPAASVARIRGPRAALGRRLYAIATRAAARAPEPLLSAPTLGFRDRRRHGAVACARLARPA
jgi:hypothetical protein